MGPLRPSYDVVIIGGAAMGAAAAWFLAADPMFQGRVLVIERDPSFSRASTTLTNSCMRQQFSTPVNIRISQFARSYVARFRANLGAEDAPEIAFDPFGYLYLAVGDPAMQVMVANHKIQRAEGVSVDLLSSDALAERFPYMATGDVRLASLGTRDEGYFDGTTMVDWWRRAARQAGVETVTATATGFRLAGGRVVAVTLSTGETVAAEWIVNAAGPAAAKIAGWAGFDLPVEPRKRITYVFDAAEPLPGRLPLTIDPSGIHVRADGAGYMAGCRPRGPDGPVAHDDFEEDQTLWPDVVWPKLAARIPAFERIKLRSSWVGHYAWNRLDQNAVVGPVPGCENLILVNGFSGHGLQQAPAMGRGVAELIVHGQHRTLDLSDLGPERILTGRPFSERNVI